MIYRCGLCDRSMRIMIFRGAFHDMFPLLGTLSFRSQKSLTKIVLSLSPPILKECESCI